MAPAGHCNIPKVGDPTVVASGAKFGKQWRSMAVDNQQQDEIECLGSAPEGGRGDRCERAASGDSVGVDTDEDDYDAIIKLGR